MTLDDLKKLDDVIVNCTWCKLQNQSTIEQFDYDRNMPSYRLNIPLVTYRITSILYRASINNKTWYIARWNDRVQISEEMPNQWLVYLMLAPDVVVHT